MASCEQHDYEPMQKAIISEQSNLVIVESERQAKFPSSPYIHHRPHQMLTNLIKIFQTTFYDFELTGKRRE